MFLFAYTVSMRKPMSIREDAALQSAVWAETNMTGGLVISPGPRPISMHNSDGTGQPLVALGEFGADIVRFGPGQGVGSHTHEGDHILFVLSGEGVLTYSGDRYKLYPGLCYLVPGNLSHAIQSESELVLIAVGNRHYPIGSDRRMTPVLPETE
jgi:quercetin dioxygenase-like cupin family protein